MLLFKVFPPLLSPPQKKVRIINLSLKKSHDGQLDYFKISVPILRGQQNLCLTFSSSILYNSLLCSSMFSSLFRNGDGIPSTVNFFPQHKEVISKGLVSYCQTVCQQWTETKTLPELLPYQFAACPWQISLSPPGTRIVKFTVLLPSLLDWIDGSLLFSPLKMTFVTRKGDQHRNPSQILLNWSLLL